MAKAPLSARDEMIQVQGADAPKIELYGKIQSAKESDLHFPITGTVEKVFVIDGQTVEQGEPLVSLSNHAKKAEIQESQLQIQASEQELDKLRTIQKNSKYSSLRTSTHCT